MPQILLVIGSVLVLAGLGGIAAGAPSWALGLGLGSTLIQSGTIGFVGGLILVAMSQLLRSIQDLSVRIDMLARSQPAGAPRQIPAPSAAHAPEPSMQPVPMPQAREFPPREQQREPAPQGREFARDPREQPREPARARREPPPMPAPHDDRYPEEPRMAPPERRAPPPPQDRRMAPPPPPQDDWGRAPAPAADPYHQMPAPAPAPRTRQPEAAPQQFAAAPAVPTVVRSGIIGGMAYTLYSDGSIEAELPIGTVRFDSIQELQEHVSNTGMDADMQFHEPVRN